MTTLPSPNAPTDIDHASAELRRGLARSRAIVRNSADLIALTTAEPALGEKDRRADELSPADPLG